MHWTSAVAEHQQLEQALTVAAEQVRLSLAPRDPDLALIFVSGHFAEHYSEVPKLLARVLPAPHVLGCSAGGVIGGGREVEQRPAVSITAAVLPDVDLRSIELPGGTLPDSADALLARQLGGAGAPPVLLLLADPFSADAERLLVLLDRTYPASLKLGGLASGGRAAGENALFLDGELRRKGIVGLALSGNLQVDPIVAQGCRPIGDPMFVTRAHGHWLQELDGQPALNMLGAVQARLSPQDQALFRHALFVGVGMPGAREQYGMGDFLIRNIAGVSAEHGALAIAAQLKDGMVVQFHLRDAATSAADLRGLLARYAAQTPTPPAGALLFSCMGRGENLYGQPDHDTRLLRQYLGDIPIGGFFCNGEIGPVQGATYLHGYTSAVGILRARS